jgi:transposase
LDRK